jgi:hypothetical protein
MDTRRQEGVEFSLPGVEKKLPFGSSAFRLKIPPARNSSLHSTPYFRLALRTERGIALAVRESVSELRTFVAPSPLILWTILLVQKGGAMTLIQRAGVNPT